MRDVAEFVGPFRRMVEAFSLRPSMILVGENDSADATAERLAAWEAARVFSFCTGVPRFGRVASAARSAHLAAVRNRLIEEALRDPWDWALFQDVQKHSPQNLPSSLAAHLVDIVAPAVRNPGGIFYDTWCFRNLNGGVLSFLSTTAGLVEVAAVGGVFAVRRSVLEAGCRFVGGGSGACDSVGLCTTARKHGYRVWVDASLVAVHCARPQQMEHRLGDNSALPGPPASSTPR